MIKKQTLADEQLVHAFQRTLSTHCFDLLYQRYVGKVYQTCLSFTNDTQDAQDCAHDIFLKAFHKLDSFAHQSSFSTWLYAIAHNYCRDQHRLRKRLPTEPLAPDLVQTLAGNSPFPDDPDGDQLRLLERQLAKLPPSDVDLLRLKYEQGLSIVALSQHFQLSGSAVKMRLKRSRDRLRSLCVEDRDA